MLDLGLAMLDPSQSDLLYITRFHVSYRTKKDYSTAIMDRKKAPHKLQVEDSKQDDNSIVEMTQAKMDELKIFRGDAVILKGMCTTTLARIFACFFGSGHGSKLSRQISLFLYLSLSRLHFTSRMVDVHYDDIFRLMS